MSKDEDPIAKVLRAAAFAAHKHRMQRRKDEDASPYINHPLAVASVLANEGEIDDPDVLCAALLHDTIEDTETTAEELRAAFGPAVAHLVEEVSDDKSLNKDRRKLLQIEHAPHLSRGAKQVKLGDMICNVRDTLYNPPATWDDTRKLAYCEWASGVVAGARDASPALAEVFEEVCKRRHRIESRQPDGVAP